MMFIWWELLAFIGLGLVVVGLYLIFPPIAWIAGGTAIFLAAAKGAGRWGS